MTVWCEKLVKPGVLPQRCKFKQIKKNGQNGCNFFSILKMAALPLSEKLSDLFYCL